MTYLSEYCPPHEKKYIFIHGTNTASYYEILRTQKIDKILQKLAPPWRMSGGLNMKIVQYSGSLHPEEKKQNSGLFLKAVLFFFVLQWSTNCTEQN